ncbi:MAG TPA: TetR/AcrR family transcriptional regulator [Stackebrandtia sp.]|jgi:AcrR family transcriptional regulator|uniref:TetR/AcrR family transcriptional regulator n=1 Tax=Stackebrandtia sp. TaxID=2023065 RepID=UPI002D24F86D|nr:TetR/AcrR family transcriptional regulator [Stackebrandtia sp.]HZE37615.1 TetR/AcrR family transcriptional regulator [Stackebrandtia sp.]
MPRAGLSPDAVVDAALEVTDANGPETLTLAAVASHAGVATPSLYKHISSLAELRLMVAARVANQLGDAVTAAVLGLGGAKAVAAFMRAWRRYALDHPPRYRSIPQSGGDYAPWVEASQRSLGVLFPILDACGVTGVDAVHMVRGIRAAAHGFVVVQLSEGFQLGADVDESYERLIAAVTASLP